VCGAPRPARVLQVLRFLAVNLDNVLRGVGLGNLAPLLQPTLPVAISFFTFMALSYVIDVYRRQLTLARPMDLAVYLAFFPHLVAGPIVRGGELLPRSDVVATPRRSTTRRPCG